MVCFGYPTKAQREREQPKRFHEKFIVFEDRYRQLTEGDLVGCTRRWRTGCARFEKAASAYASNVGQSMYARKLASDFSKEMSRSVRRILEEWSSE